MFTIRPKQPYFATLLDQALNLRSLLLLIAMLQGLLIAVLLLKRGRSKGLVQDFLLSTLLIFLALSLIEHFIGFMGVFDSMREAGHDLTFFPFSNYLTWGPLIWLYVQAVTDKNFQWSNMRWRHFVPAILNYVLHFAVWGLPEKTKFALFNTTWFWPSTSLIDLFFYIQTAVYLGYSYKRLREYGRLLETEFSNTSKMTLDWLQHFIYGFCIYLCIDLCFNVAGMFVQLRYVDSYWLELIRAIHLYYISVTGWTFAQKSVVAYAELERRETVLHPVEAARSAEILMSAKTIFSPEELDKRRAQLLVYMDQERPWLDPELTLSQLAARLNMNTSQLSFLVNNGLDKNFNDFVNHYRVEAVKEKMQDASLAHLSLLGIAFECGFNSKATFNRAFKKLSGEAPTAYKRLKS